MGSMTWRRCLSTLQRYAQEPGPLCAALWAAFGCQMLNICMFLKLVTEIPFFRICRLVVFVEIALHDMLEGLFGLVLFFLLKQDVCLVPSFLQQIKALWEMYKDSNPSSFPEKWLKKNWVLGTFTMEMIEFMPLCLQDLTLSVLWPQVSMILYSHVWVSENTHPPRIISPTMIWSVSIWVTSNEFFLFVSFKKGFGLQHCSECSEYPISSLTSQLVNVKVQGLAQSVHVLNRMVRYKRSVGNVSWLLLTSWLCPEIQESAGWPGLQVYQEAL